MDIGLILAGGRSRRFGPDDKLTALLRGLPLVTHVARALAGVPLAERLIVAGSGAVAEAAAGMRPVMIDNSDTGQSETLRLGVQAAIDLGATRVLIVLGDMPYVTPQHLTQVLAAARAGPAASSNGKRPMPPAAFPMASFPALLATKGDKGAAPILRALPHEALIQAAPEMLIDIDTPEALDQAHRTRA